MKLDFFIWNNSAETRELLKELEEELKKTENNILEFGGLLNSKKIAIDYANKLGYYQGLKFIKRLLEERNDDEIT